MGMDVYGKAPVTEAGRYFRANVWLWHPLWECCTDFAPKTTGGVVHGHTNDGDGLDAEGSLALARILDNAIRNGEMVRYIANRDARLAALPDEPCSLCGGTGVRTDAIGIAQHMPDRLVQREDGTNQTGWCNGCDGRGHVRPCATWYWLDLDSVLEFQRFLSTCGGFEIW